VIELEFRNVDFCGRKKTGETEEKPAEHGTNNNKLNRVMTPGPGFEPGVTLRSPLLNNSKRNK